MRCVENRAEPERAAEILYALHLGTLELKSMYERDADDEAAWLRDLQVPPGSPKPGATLLLAATTHIDSDFTTSGLGLSDVSSFEPWLAQHLVNRIPRTLAPSRADAAAMCLFAGCGRWDRVLAVAASSTDDSAYLYKAAALVERGLPDAALLVLDEEIKRCQNEEPYLVDSLVNDGRYKKAWLLLHIGDPASARRELAKVFASDPQFLDYAGLVEVTQGQATGVPAERRRAPIPENVRREVWRRDGGRCVECGSEPG